MWQKRVTCVMIFFLTIVATACNEEPEEGDKASTKDESYEFIIAARTEFERNPKISWGEGNYFVVWTHQLDGEFFSYEIRGKQVTNEGCPANLEDLKVAEQIEAYHPEVSVTYNGNLFLIVWDGMDRISGKRMTENGIIIDQSEIPIAGEYRYRPEVAGGESNFLVSWDFRLLDQDQYDIYAARVTLEGEVLDLSGIPVSTEPQHQFVNGVAWNGRDYFISWTDFQDEDGTDLYGTRVTPEGAVLEPRKIPISTARKMQGGGSLAWNGEIFLVVWTDSRTEPDEDCEECHSERFRDIYGARVTAEGEVLDPEGIPICTVEKEQKSPSVAWNGEVFLVVWRDMRGEPESACPDPATETCGDPKYADLYAARVTADGEVLDPEGFPVTTAPGEQSLPQVASDGKNFLVVWEDYRKAESDPNVYDPDIYGAIIGEGEPCETEETTSGTSGEEESGGTPDEGGTGGSLEEPGSGEEATAHSEETAATAPEGAATDEDRRGSSSGGGGCGFTPILPPTRSGIAFLLLALSCTPLFSILRRRR